MSRIGKFMETANRMWLSSAGEVGEKWELTANGYKVSF